jgi:Ni,Fe-hydrogenase III large subunit
MDISNIEKKPMTHKLRIWMDEIGKLYSEIATYELLCEDWHFTQTWKVLA